jgi:DNA-binding response OmpR family regulator
VRIILIVDDRPEIRELVEVTLGMDGYHIVQASDRETALKKAKETSPDLVILDVMMGGDEDGYDVCRQLKARPETGNSKIIMLTAKARDIDRKAGIDAGADGYFTKPFSPLELMDKVEELLG